MSFQQLNAIAMAHTTLLLKLPSNARHAARHSRHCSLCSLHVTPMHWCASLSGMTFQLIDSIAMAQTIRLLTSCLHCAACAALQTTSAWKSSQSEHEALSWTLTATDPTRHFRRTKQGRQVRLSRMSFQLLDAIAVSYAIRLLKLPPMRGTPSIVHIRLL